MGKPPAKQITLKQFIGVVIACVIAWPIYSSIVFGPRPPMPVTTQTTAPNTPAAKPKLNAPQAQAPVLTTGSGTPPADTSPPDPNPIDSTALDSTSSDVPVVNDFSAPTPGGDLGVVEYSVSSSCPVDVTYMSDGSGIEQESDVEDGWSTAATPGTFASLSAQLKCEDGTVTVTLDQDGQTLGEATSSGDYTIASASYP